LNQILEKFLHSLKNLQKKRRSFELVIFELVEF